MSSVARPVLGATLVLTVLTATVARAADRPTAGANPRLDTTATGCQGISVGPATEVVSNQTRLADDLSVWPDTAFGVLPDGGAYRFVAAGRPDTQPPHQTRVVTVRGTLDNPVAGGVTAATLVAGRPAGYDYLSGGPVYRDPASGVVLQMLHGEHRYGPGNGLFYSELNLGRYDPTTGTTTLLGAIVRPNADPAAVQRNSVDADLGDPAFAVQTVLGVVYLYVYFPDFAVDSAGHIGQVSLAVARAPLSEVLSAAGAGTVSPWRKYHDGGWTEPALGGRSSSVQPGSLAWAPSVVHSAALDLTMMVAGVSPHEFVLATSADGLSAWTDRVTLFTDPGNFDAYPTIVGEDGDPANPGRRFAVYYTQWPNTSSPDWNNARLMRRVVTCTQGGPATYSALIAYTDGTHHRVTTGPVTTAGLAPEATWALPATAEPGTVPLLGCYTGGLDYMLSLDPRCEGTTLVQTEGFIYTAPPARPYTALYRCHPAGGGDHFLATTASCAGKVLDGLLGYALTTSSVPFVRYRAVRHWVTTGPVTSGYTIESRWADAHWYLDSAAGPGEIPLYGCAYNVPGGVNHMISRDAHCEGVTVLRLEGWIYPVPPPGIDTVAVYRCYAAQANDHFVSDDPACEPAGGGGPDAGLLGYVRTAPQIPG